MNRSIISPLSYIAHTPTRRLIISRSIVRPLSSLATTMTLEATGSEPAVPVLDANSSYKPRYIDIGINLADPIFRGVYHGKERHPDDLHAVVSRAQEVGCQKLIITGSDFTSSRHALDIAKEYPGIVYTTAGIHPCSSAIFSKAHSHLALSEHAMPSDPDPAQPAASGGDGDEPDAERTAEIIAELRRLVEGARAAQPGALVAFGEFGLDYDRLHYSPRRVQLHAFAAQLDLVLSLRPQPPLFLHSRAAHADFVALLRAKFGDRLERLERGGVVHSFTGSAAEMRELAALGLHIGTNGCSFKTPDNCAVVRDIPPDRLMLETDGPWCEVRPTHAGWRYLLEAKAKGEGIYAAAAAAAAPADGDGDDSAPAALSSGSTPAAATPTGSGTATPNPQVQPKPVRPPKKPQRKEPEVPERWRAVKKEKWTEGAMVKGRNEPCMIERVAQVVAGVRGEPLRDVCEAAWANTVKVFGLDDDGKA